MSQQLVRVGQHVINLAAVSAAHWEGRTLYVHLTGGRFVTFKGDEADLVWSAVSEEAVELGQPAGQRE